MCSCTLERSTLLARRRIAIATCRYATCSQQKKDNEAGVTRSFKVQKRHCKEFRLLLTAIVKNSFAEPFTCLIAHWQQRISVLFNEHTDTNPRVFHAQRRLARSARPKAQGPRPKAQGPRPKPSNAQRQYVDSPQLIGSSDSGMIQTKNNICAHISATSRTISTR